MTDRRGGAALRIVVRALLILPFCLAAWHFSAGAFSWVAGRIAAPAVGAVAGSVTSMAVRDRVIHYTVALELPYRPGAAPTLVADVEVSGTLYTFGIAVFLALSLAAKASRRWLPIAIGAAVLVVVPAFGVACDALKQLAVSPELAGLLAWRGFTREALALGYQAGTLLLPTLVPVALWMGLNRAAWDPQREGGGVPTA